MQNQQHVSSALNRLIVGANQSFDLHGLWQSTSRMRTAVQNLTTVAAG